MKKFILLFYLVAFFILWSIYRRADRAAIFRGGARNNTELQIMLYGENVADAKPIINYDGITIERIVSVENNYLFASFFEILKIQPCRSEFGHLFKIIREK
ncbi:MAG: cyclomaltodextrinase N-terminal domain-containing protein [Saprospiraceae bacterium]